MTVSLDIEGVFENDAAIGILLRLDTSDGMLNGELEETIHVSPTTLATGLQKAEEADLIVESRNADDHGNAKRYFLTERGKAIQNQMQVLGMDEAYERFFQSYQKLNEAESDLFERISDAQLDDPRWPSDRDPRERP